MNAALYSNSAHLSAWLEKGRKGISLFISWFQIVSTIKFFLTRTQKLITNRIQSNLPLKIELFLSENCQWIVWSSFVKHLNVHNFKRFSFFLSFFFALVTYSRMYCALLSYVNNRMRSNVLKSQCAYGSGLFYSVWIRRLRIASWKC